MKTRMEKEEPITQHYPDGKPEEITILHYRYTGDVGIAEQSALKIVFEEIGHLLCKRRIACYLTLFHPELTITATLVERCYNVFRRMLPVVNHIETYDLDETRVCYDGWLVTPSTFRKSRRRTLFDIYSIVNPLIPCHDIGYNIVNDLVKNDSGRWITYEWRLSEIITDPAKYRYFLLIWRRFPTLQGVYNILLLFFPAEVCLHILGFGQLAARRRK